MNFIKVRSFTLSAIFISLGMISCKKEYPDFPYNAIERFVIKDANGKDLKALIKNNEIFITFPPAQTIPDTIAPEITVSEKALISPASGKKVAFKNGTTYTVTAQNGKQANYVIRLGNSQPIPYYTILPLVMYKNKGIARHQTNLQLNGDFFETPSKTTIYLVRVKDGKEAKLNVSSGSFHSLTSEPLPATIDTGLYYIRLVTGSRTVSDKNKTVIVTLKTQAPTFQNTTITAKRGQIFTLAGTDLKTVTELYMYDADYVWVKFEIVSATDTSITLRIPMDASLGIYSGYSEGKYDNPKNYEEGQIFPEFNLSVIQ